MKLPVWCELIKYKLSMAVACSAGTGYFLFSNSFDTGLIPVVSGVFLMASGSAVLNQYTEREQDSLMGRTKGRPIPSKKVTPAEAKRLLAFLLIAGSCVLLTTGIIPFALGMLTVFLYNLVYTSLKKTTALAIIPGALVGAIPPLIGFTAAGGTVFNQKILLFATFMFLWQMPHFWLLLIKYGKEYKSAGFITISDYLNEGEIRNIAFLWIFLTSVFLMFFTGLSDIFSKFFTSIIFILSPLFIFFFYKMLFSQNRSSGVTKAFIALNVFSILVMFLLIADSILT